MDSGIAGSQCDVTVIVVMAMTSESFKGTSAGKQIKVIALRLYRTFVKLLLQSKRCSSSELLRF